MEMSCGYHRGRSPDHGLSDRSLILKHTVAQSSPPVCVCVSVRETLQETNIPENQYMKRLHSVTPRPGSISVRTFTLETQASDACSVGVTLE